ncbi:hypothetical protein LCGC14_2790410, partial [marine sediment metagenome]
IGHTLTSVRDGIQDVSQEFVAEYTIRTWANIVELLNDILKGPVQELEGTTRVTFPEDYHEYCHPDVCTYRRRQLEVVKVEDTGNCGDH